MSITCFAGRSGEHHGRRVPAYAGTSLQGILTLRGRAIYDTAKFMKQYVIDELRLQDYAALKGYLGQHFIADSIEGIYWVPVPDEILSRVQMEHVDCQPHCFSVELSEDKISCELLVRTRKRVRCDCMGYADARQRTWFMQTMDALLDELDIRT